jgi:hypothetical protein
MQKTKRYLQIFDQNAKLCFKRPEMSVECRKQIRRRQKMMSENYKVSLSLARACKVKKVYLHLAKKKYFKFKSL